MNQISLFEYLMISAAVILSWRMYHAAHPPPVEGASSNPPGIPQIGPIEKRGVPTAPAAEAATPLAETLKRITRAGGGDEVSALLEGAKLAYETIIQAFAYGDLTEHAHLLTEAVRRDFLDAIAERHARGESHTLIFIGFSTAEIVAAGLDRGQAWMDVHFVADIVSVTRNKDGKATAGDPARVVQSDEVWTFEGDLRGPDPDWRLAATEPTE